MGKIFKTILALGMMIATIYLSAFLIFLASGPMSWYGAATFITAIIAGLASLATAGTWLCNIWNW